MTRPLAATSFQWFPTAVVPVATVLFERAGYGFTMLFILAGVICLWIVLRDWPHRGHWLFGSTAACSAAAWPRIVAQPADGVTTQAASIAVMGLGFLLIGLFDHRLSTQSLPGRGMPEQTSQS